eukprot:gnl/Carplike_NY0171/9951_a13967_186.p1 GENE.gnl/Carplike_NY0171/9951_a13967_186~~gnl/Carplike_NY0171/9951_a13967_186.p1  ORF type:complete len:238 (+),score=74.50 gnl/Carplike_NY0171/9951_a13967_186:1-714(+)
MSKVLVTTSIHPKCKTLLYLISDMLTIFPSFYYFKRKKRPIEKVFSYAEKKGFTHVIIFQAHARKPFGLIISAIRKEPVTLTFRLRGVVPRRNISGSAAPTKHEFELLMHNFDTAIGARIASVFRGLMPSNPDFKGRQCVVFHNEDDFILFSAYRYIFEDLHKKNKKDYVNPSKRDLLRKKKKLRANASKSTDLSDEDEEDDEFDLPLDDDEAELQDDGEDIDLGGDEEEEEEDEGR